jgi:hypothetical protein
MLLEDFRRIVTAFADNPSDVDISKGTLLLQLRGEVVEARVYHRLGELVVEDSGVEYTPGQWIVQRVAQLHTLADRILSNVQRPAHFVTPSGSLLDQQNFAANLEDSPTDDAVQTALEVVSRRLAGTTSVLFLTSDAGEGKTTLIQQLAIAQAQRYKAKSSDWLLVPVPLGGRTFLRFDDVVVAALVNRLRFQFLYYEAFLELVKLGVVVPAFDGFEEMIIEGSTGEAISAVGNLVTQLDSAGSVLLAARKAFFDYQSFRTQARLFDAIGKDSVSFARLALHRWSREHFLEYCEMCGLTNGPETYAAIADRLGESHPLLTRAVLVRRLVDVAKDSPSLTALIETLGSSPQDYFYQFVNALVQREAHDKWLDKYGDPPTPLLSVSEHHELLAALAQEMWFSSTDTLRQDVVALVAELFCDTKDKAPQTTREIRERLKQHSLLVKASATSSLAFDHEDFRSFYLGEALGRAMGRCDHGELRTFLQVSSLPTACIEQACLMLRREQFKVTPILQAIQALASAELSTSFVRENSGVLAIRMLSGHSEDKVVLRDMHFPSDALRGVRLQKVEFVSCYFQPTSTVGATLVDCTFTDCRFERLEVGDGAAVSAILNNSVVDSLLRTDRDDHIFDPEQIRSALRSYGFADVQEPNLNPQTVTGDTDEKVRVLERALRAFTRSTHVNESVFRLRLGIKANIFLEEIVPDLVSRSVIEEVPYLGSGVQKRFRMSVAMSSVDSALTSCAGSYEKFIAKFGA